MLQATPEQWTAVRRVFKGARVAAGVGSLMVLAPGAGATPLDRLCGAQSPAAIHAPARPDYLLRRQPRVWLLVIAGQEGLIGDCRGMQLAAYLMKHPPAQPMHAVVLEARVAGHDGVGMASVLAAGAKGGGLMGVDRDGLVQEGCGRRLNHGNNAVLRRKLNELKESMDDTTLPESEREEARQEF